MHAWGKVAPASRKGAQEQVYQGSQEAHVEQGERPEFGVQLTQHTEEPQQNEPARIEDRVPSRASRHREALHGIPSHWGPAPARRRPIAPLRDPVIPATGDE